MTNARAEALPTASSASALDSLLNEYRTLATSEREKGAMFEELTRQFLLNDARFAHQFKEVYLWSEWPERQTGDTGIDLVAIPADENAGLVAIQCKFYAPGHTVHKRDIDSFLTASGKAPFTRRILVDTSGTAWGKNSQDAIEGQHIPVSRITLADLRDSDIDWRTYALGSRQAPTTRERKVPRDHQVRARSAVMAGFDTSDRGQLIMACGTGKTFTSLIIAREFMEREGGSARILFAVPSLALLKQTLDDWSVEVDSAFTAWAVCSDTKVSARSDAPADSTVDLPIPATTDAQRLALSLGANNDAEGLQVVFATYQSIEVIHQAQELAGETWRDFDLVICDEAHRTTGAKLTTANESAFTKIHDDAFIRRSKTLYMTATPRIFAENAKSKASQKDVILTSMDDKDTYGPVFFRLGFGQAVKENLLTDYKVIILTVSEEEVSQKYQLIAEMDGELNLDTAAKLTGCWNALAKRKNPGSDVDYGSDCSPMRRAEGKDFGYIILPVAIPAGMSPEQALDDNERFKVVWQVLKALRAHDERLDAAINSMELNGQGPENIIVDTVSLASDKRSSDPLEGSSTEPGGQDPLATGVQGHLALLPSDWKEAVFGRIVKKVGSSLYWVDWSKDIATVANRYIHLINQLLEDPQRQSAFQDFVKALQTTLNPAVDRNAAVEMLAQHMLTAPLFEAMFPDHSFSKQNPVSRAMNTIVEMLASHSMFENERTSLDAFYQAMIERIEAVHTLAGKQDIMRTLYDRFFSQAFPSMSERLGIVFTPVEVVDFIIRSADDAMRTAFNQTLADPGVAIIEPFAGTGTFVARLLQLGVIPPEALERKYLQEIFANEVVLLSYYIASINIEQVYHQVRAEQGVDEDYVEFPGMTLTDTFQLHEDDGTMLEGFEGLAANNERARAEKAAPITVVIMNPPYSAGQNSANDNNQNLAYPRLDKRIAETYAAQSSGANKNSLYDSYFRALRWASDRIGQRGVIAFVSNSSFIDGNSADGVRLSLQEEFSQIFIYDLKGNARTSGERRRREAGNVFEEGSRTGVAITVLVKDPEYVGSAEIFYAEAEDYATRQEKLNQIQAYSSIAGINKAEAFSRVEPNEHGDWISIRDERFATFQEIGNKDFKDKEASPAVFRQYSNGLQTNRDPWCYNFSHDVVAANMQLMIANYNSQLAVGKQNYDSRQIKWSPSLEISFKRKIKAVFDASKIQTSTYRPFCRMSVYFDQMMNHRTYRLPKLFPTPAHPNISFVVSQGEISKIGPLMINSLPNHHLVGDAQTFPLYTWEPISSASNHEPDLFSLDAEEETTQTDEAAHTSALDFTRPIGEQIPILLNGYRRVDNITDTTLAVYRAHYADATITKEDIFFYVYALLHHPEYREHYEADLKKMLPHIPKVEGFAQYVTVGRKLAHLHVNYEQVEPWASVQEEASLHAPEDAWQRYRIGTRKMRFPKLGRKEKDYTRLEYNEYMTLVGIPEQAQHYTISGRSPLDWVIDRYYVKTDEASGIINDPNAFLREQGRPDAVVDLIKRLVTVSMCTQELVASLPKLEIPANA